MSIPRSRMFKNADKDADELRRRRQDQSLELRKSKKEEQLQKRRNILPSHLDEDIPVEDTNKENEPINFDKLIQEMQATDLKARHLALQKCRKILSRANNPPIEEFYQRGAIKVLTDSLTGPDEVVFEAAWALTNIASGHSTFTKAVANSGANRKLVELLNHKSDTIVEQCVWALGNIAGDSAQLRDMVIKDGVVEPTLKFLERVYSKPAMVNNIAWMLSNLCRNKNPCPPNPVVKKLLPIFRQLLQYPENSNIVVDAGWALAYASDPANDFIDDILSSGCVPILVKLLSSGQSKVISPALRTIGNLVIGTDLQTQKVLDCGLLAQVPALLNNQSWHIVKESCWMLSNITAGNVNQISQVISYNLIPMVLHVIQTQEFRVQKEACWIISNLVNGGTPEHLDYLACNEGIETFTHLLEVTDVKVLQLTIETLTKLFMHGHSQGHLDKYCMALENSGGLDLMENLQQHENNQVYSAAFNFIDRYFSDEETAASSSPAHGGIAPDSTNPYATADHNNPTSTFAGEDEIRFHAEGLDQHTTFDF